MERRDQRIVTGGHTGVKGVSLARYDEEQAQAPSPHNKLVKRDDNRLFPELPLYCEGYPKPLLRGMFHLIFALLLGPFGLWHLTTESKGIFEGRVAAILYILGSFTCYFISALYHVGRWSVQTEIVLQKLDHCAICIFAAGTNTPVALLLLPKGPGLMLFTLSWGTAIWTSWNVFSQRPAVWRIVISCSSILPFFIILWYRMNTLEYFCMLGNSIAMGLGAAAFISQSPNLWPTVFGYHEVFHILTLIGGSCIYLCNWSVIRRSCNMYANDIDVLQIVQSFLYNELWMGMGSGYQTDVGED